MTKIRHLPMLLIFLAASTVAQAQGRDTPDSKFRILHYEPLTAGKLTGRSRLAGQTIRFQALGRDFSIRLRDNNRLLQGLPRERRQAILQTMEVLRGQLDRVPGSWVRLTRSGGEVRGLIWDGQEMFVIAPEHEIAISSATPSIVQARGPAIYRWADTENHYSDIVKRHPQAAETTSAELYSLLTGELAAKAQAHGGSVHYRLDIAALGDSEYTNVLGSLSEQGMIDRVNGVDGIFESQLGVRINLVELRTFTAVDDPFGTIFPATIDPSALIDDLACYKCGAPDNCETQVPPPNCGDPTLSPLGLVHLFTGLNLDGATVGIAFLGTVCHAAVGVSVTQAINGPSPNYLVTAHEFGHNFNAPHDADPDEACAGVDDTFLMAPRFNGNETFSSCSIEQIQTQINSVSCLTILPGADVGVFLSAADPHIRVGETTMITASATNNGPQTATNSLVVIDLGPLLTVGPGQLNPACTTIDGQVLSCPAGDLAPGSQRFFDQLVETVSQFGTASIVATVSSDIADDDTSNNSDSLGLPVVIRLVDLLAEIGPLPTGLVTGGRSSFSVTLTNLGPDVASQPEIDLSAGGTGLSFFSVTADIGSCVHTARAATCTTADLGDTQTITVTFDALSAGTFTITATAQTASAEEFDTNATNDTVNASISLRNSNTTSGGGGSFGFWLLGILLFSGAWRRLVYR